ncbi:UDP-N-acetylmuramoyl-L-alanyl-D-glutamate--2,6-diaminopimelate ligase [Pasteuria penetrans]|uniref:UDP-N-acetylmuramoyl-L-alanyl-D-glutamate--2, 6-diaminopimelate ligase n=1 Tax=Pasteuria penetrans TaxID=86005 RepID=UPI001FEA9C39|nr:UDP-N-acetylmuramoyl-L-alanyl-D-glutamate--2,6-diaminopimelate ligase [Pasteuria penetrans]
MLSQGSERGISVAKLMTSLPAYRQKGQLTGTVRSIQIHSSAVKPGDLFVAQCGTRVDGHCFLQAAVTRGAVAVVVDEESTEQEVIEQLEVPVFYVRDTRRVLAQLSACFYDYPSESLSVIGVTGTNGKTSTVQFLRQILVAAGKVTGTIGTLGLQYGSQTVALPNTTPGALQMQKFLAQLRDEGCTHAAVEVSSIGLAMGRTWGCRFCVAVLTNISRDHLDYHQTMERYIAAKQSLFSQLGSAYARSPVQRPVAVINATAIASSSFVEATAAAVLTYAVDSSADVQALDLQSDCNRGITRFRLRTWAEEAEVQVPGVGRFYIENILAAVTTALVLGVPFSLLTTILPDLRAVQGRLERVDRSQDPFPVWLDYAHTPDGLIQVLQTLRSQLSGRLFCMVGCGGDRDRGKRAAMAQAAVQESDHVVFTSDNPRFENPLSILEDMRMGIDGGYADRCEWIADRREAIHWVLQAARPGDGVVLAGKGHEEYQEIAGERLPFSDRVVAQQQLAALEKKGWPYATQ